MLFRHVPSGVVNSVVAGSHRADLLGWSDDWVLVEVDDAGEDELVPEWVETIVGDNGEESDTV